MDKGKRQKMSKVRNKKQSPLCSHIQPNSKKRKVGTPKRRDSLLQMSSLLGPQKSNRIYRVCTVAFRGKEICTIETEILFSKKLEPKRKIKTL